MATKKEFIIEKLKNFSIFISETIGKDNNIYKKVLQYSENVELFLREFIQLTQLAKTDEKGNKYFDKENVLKLLEINGVNSENQKSELNFDKLMRYLNMFIKVLNY